MNNAQQIEQRVRSLVIRAEQAQKSDDALKFSQAACNAANAMACLQSIRLQEKESEQAS